ncbi:MAG TPA: hypothetical protein VKD47_04810 [Miltoncostaeaceae bacterium]|nr:hypothetical protein [Miltoncostaeaceae bacterium]
MNSIKRALSITAALMLVAGGLSGAALGKTTKTHKATTHHKAGAACSTSQVGKKSTTSTGKKLTCELKGTTYRWTLTK